MRSCERNSLRWCRNSSGCWSWRRFSTASASGADRSTSICPKPIIEFDEFGAMKAVTRAERNWAHRLIEEFMLSANECVASWLQNLGVPVALSHPRKAGAAASGRIRGDRGGVRLFAGHWQPAGADLPHEKRAAGAAGARRSADARAGRRAATKCRRTSPSRRGCTRS